jgi:hypothetical protein
MDKLIHADDDLIDEMDDGHKVTVPNSYVASKDKSIDKKQIQEEIPKTQNSPKRESVKKPTSTAAPKTNKDDDSEEKVLSEDQKREQIKANEANIQDAEVEKFEEDIKKKLEVEGFF